jgi:hypothetical protein
VQILGYRHERLTSYDAQGPTATPTASWRRRRGIELVKFVVVTANMSGYLMAFLCTTVLAHLRIEMMQLQYRTGIFLGGLHQVIQLGINN